jgi:hypothetical protein
MPDWEPLERVIEGGVALPGSLTYEASRRPFNARFQAVEPKAIVSCATAQDVSEAISFARRHGLQVAMRSGGHSFAGHSSTRGVVIDVALYAFDSPGGAVPAQARGCRQAGCLHRREGSGVPAGSPTVGVVHPWGSGRVLQNFADPDLENWADAYYGPNLTRLVRVKARYDSVNVFRFDQSLPRLT